MAIYKLEEICYLQKGRHYPPTNKFEYWNGNFSWLKIGDITPNIYKSKKKLSKLGLKTVKNYQDYQFKKNTFVMSADGTIGKLGWLEKNFYSSTHLINFNSNKKNTTNKYLYFWFCKNINLIKKYIKGSVIPNISIKDLNKILINLPLLSEQKNIIDIIEPISQGIKISENILNKISNLYRLLQLNSKNEKIKNVIKEHSNGYSYKKINIDNSGKYKIFKIKNISTENSYNKTNFFKNNLLLNGDVLTGLTGTLGTAKIIVDKNWVNNQRTLMLRSPFFLEIKTTIENSIDFLMKNAKGAVQKNISHNDILNLKINIHCYNKTLSDLYLLSSDIKQKLSLLQTKLINLLIK